MEESLEIVEGKRLLEMLHGWIDARRVCKVEIPNTRYGWITLLLGIQEVDQTYYLLIDKVKGFERALSRSPDQEVSIEFIEKDGVACQFKIQVVECLPKIIRAELPKSIYRMQRRRSFRTKAWSGTEIVFHLSQGKEERSKVKDYSLGGVAFFMDRPLEIHMGDELTRIDLTIPQGGREISFHIPKALVKRIERDPQGKDVCALEFLEMPEATQERLWLHIFKEQRSLLRKTGKI